ncbi:MAG: hypothetical protein ABI281_14450 [Caldimonas sp.]
MAWALAVMLLCVQTLGALHRIAHVDPLRLQATAVAASVAGVAEDSTTIATVAPSRSSWLQTLFAGHIGSRDCDAFDQLSHADAVFATVLDLAQAPPAQPPADAAPAWHIAAQARGYLARGPPIDA